PAGQLPRRDGLPAHGDELFGKVAQDLAALVAAHDEVLDPGAERARHVDARLDRHRVPGDERALLALGEARRLVYLEPHAVAKPVAEALAVAGAADPLARHRVHALAVRSRMDRGQRLL